MVWHWQGCGCFARKETRTRKKRIQNLKTTDPRSGGIKRMDTNRTNWSILSIEKQYRTENKTMANIRTGYFEAMAALPKQGNPLPRFRDQEHDLRVEADTNIPERYTRLMGMDCGRRVLPYMMQDHYDRTRRPTKLPAVIMENDKLRATFLPSLGGRLISLVNLSDDRELLFRNTSVQAANLSNRNAWFAGGIEWNLGQYGHAFSTCDDIFASIQRDERGEDFLRLYDYERCKGLWWHIDFHLPTGSRLLYAHTTVHNLYDTRTSMYYWTNIAVEMTDGTRVFASDDQAIYLDPYAVPSVKRYGYMKMPDINIYPGVDASYPARFPYSQEYFFTCDRDEMPWEAAVETDGNGFFEASTHPLSYRKMFCWGASAGGRHWQKFLAPGTDKEYVEIQGGLAPTQLHGMYLGNGETLCWTQVFGPVSGLPPTVSDKDYLLAKSAVTEYVESAMTMKRLLPLHRKFKAASSEPPRNLLHMGNGWGFLEAKLRGIELPPAFLFPEESISTDELPWKQFLDTGVLPDTGEASFIYPPVSNNAWREALLKAVETSTSSRNAAILKHYLGITLLEDEEAEAARARWLEAYAITPNPWTARNLAVLELRRGAVAPALDWYRKAMGASSSPDLTIAEEFIKTLVDHGGYGEALECFQSLPRHYLASSDFLAFDRARLAAELGDCDTIEKMVMDRELGNLREGDIQLNALWNRYCLLKYGEKLPLIEQLDFNQFDPD